MTIPIVYVIRNTVNGKVYLGSTRQDFRKRIGVHRCYLNNGKHANKHLQAAWLKYGEHRFDIFPLVVLTRGTLDKELRGVEERCIILFNSKSQEHGYNLMTPRSYVISDETRAKHSVAAKRMWKTKDMTERNKKISKALKGRLISDEHRKKISLANMGRPSPNKGKKFPQFSGLRNPFYGKKHTLETRERMRLSALGRKHSKETKRKMGESRMGSKNHMFGKKMPKETIAKIVAARRKNGSYGDRTV